MIRNLVVVLGDQLDEESAAFDGFDPAADCIWMAEVDEESLHVPSHKLRTALFLSAMRHFCRFLKVERGWQVQYGRLEDAANSQTLAGELSQAIRDRRPQSIVMVKPGDWRVEQALIAVARESGVPIDIREDRHFYCTLDWFRRWSAVRKQLRLEYFYREMRRTHSVLLNTSGEPEGGVWNCDKENRGSFGKHGPDPGLAAPLGFPPDNVTQEVLALVERRFAGNPGPSPLAATHFDFPVTRQQAEAALDDFVANRLPLFGAYQDAMWTAEPYLYHSRLSAAMNLKLLSPRRVVAAVEAAYRRGDVPLAAAEGFIRQVIGWREYVCGIYWTGMPGYGEGDALDAHAPLPGFYWTGQTPMRCLSETITQTLERGYAHHIQRLMVTGLFALLLGVRPREIHSWYLAVYIDAVEWVELPNVIGMSQFADGGHMASKPYAATGKYIDRMSNYCSGCRFDPAEAVGDRACPFTTLYWDFLMRNEDKLRQVPRMELQLRNLDRLTPARQAAIREKASQLQKHC